MTSNLNKCACVGILAGATMLMACGVDGLPEADAPAANADALDENDEGTSFNGWTQAISGICDLGIGVTTWSQTLTRASGDATRGGGSCFILKKPGTTCTLDSNCQAAAVAQYGASAYGYCYSGVCYSRPGSQASFCSVSPSRPPGTNGGVFLAFGATGTENVLGCMTKTAGPNTGCGGTNTSLYMRTVKPVTYANTQWP
jgi:hypothetical protein